MASVSPRDQGDPIIKRDIHLGLVGTILLIYMSLAQTVCYTGPQLQGIHYRGVGYS